MNTSAMAQYQANQIAIRERIKQLEGHLAKHEVKARANPSSFGYAGDLGRVEINLAELVAFLAN